MKKNKEIIKEFIEKGANLEHERWARWQKHMFGKGIVIKYPSIPNFDEGDMIIPAELTNRWFRQIDTPYSELSEPEKESDRKETRSYIPLLEEALKSQRNDIVEKIEKEIEFNFSAKPADRDEEIDERAYNSALSRILKIIKE